MTTVMHAVSRNYDYIVHFMVCLLTMPLGRLFTCTINVTELAVDNTALIFCIGESRTRWPKYEENMKQRDTWASDILKSFYEDVRTVRETFKASTNPTSSASIPADGVVLRPNTNVKTGNMRGDDYVYLKDGKPVLIPQKADLLESCIVARVEDFALFRVSTALDSKRSTPKKFISSDKKQLHLPPEMSSVHVVFTDYYYPDGIEFPGMFTTRFAVIV